MRQIEGWKAGCWLILTGLAWLFRKTIEDLFFNWIGEKATNYIIGLDIAKLISNLIEFGPTVLLIGLGVYFLFKKILFAPISFNFSNYFLNLSSRKESKGTSGDLMVYGEIEYRITSFFAEGRNKSSNPIENVNGYIQSNVTNEKIPILLDGMLPKDTNGIPGKCNFRVTALFPKSTPDLEGYTIDDFWSHFGEFTFIFEYEKEKYIKSFSESEIKKLLEHLKSEANQGIIPEGTPRVKPKNSNG